MHLRLSTASRKFKLSLTDRLLEKFVNISDWLTNHVLSGSKDQTYVVIFGPGFKTFLRVSGSRWHTTEGANKLLCNHFISNTSNYNCLYNIEL